MDEIDNRQLSVSLYVVPERGTMRSCYERTVAKMQNISAACLAQQPPRKWCPTEVVPWISLGAGYGAFLYAMRTLACSHLPCLPFTESRLDSDFPVSRTEPPDSSAAASKLAGSDYGYAIPWEYPLFYSWDLGRQINNATLRWPELHYYEHAKHVALCE